MQTPPASIALDTLNIPHTIFHHQGSVESYEQAAQERNQRVGQVVKSILFRVRENEFALVLAAGSKPISWKKLRKALGRSRISTATEEEVLDVTGYRVGTVSPFGLKKQVRVLIEANVLKEEIISTGSGMRNIAIIIKSQDLRVALKDAEVVELIGEQE
ncbi:MAG: aminoacyl-tRNA deacylase [Anaerolineales bacterium]